MPPNQPHWWGVFAVEGDEGSFSPAVRVDLGAYGAGSATFTCEACDAEFHDFAALAEHLAKIHDFDWRADWR